MAGVSPGLFLFLPHLLQVVSEYPKRAGNRSQHGSVFILFHQLLPLSLLQTKKTNSALKVAVSNLFEFGAVL